MKTSFALISAAMVALLSATLSAADTKKASINAGDEKFIKKIAESGMTEVKLSELAAQKATRAEVKELAQMLVNEHNTMNEALQSLATSKSVQLSAIIAPSGAAKFKELERLSGKSFDDEFLSTMASSHRRSVAAFEDASKDVTDGDLKSFVNEHLATLRTHLDKIVKLQPPAADVPITLPPI